MFTLYFGNTTKKDISTKRVNYRNWVKIENLVWKTPHDEDRPQITIEYSDDNLNWNYAFCPDNGTYFWITSIVSVRNNIWDISLENDVLATFHHAIKQCRSYITYGFNEDASASAKRVIDGRQTIVNKPTFSVTDASQFKLLEGWFSDTGTYLLGAVGDDGISVWALSRDQMDALVYQLQDHSEEEAAERMENLGIPVTAESVAGYATTASMFLSTAIDSIRSCIHVPVSIEYYRRAVASDGTGEVVLGEYHTHITAYKVASKNTTTTQTVTIPWQDSGNWERMMTQISIYMPFFGTVAVPVDKLNAYDTISVKESYCALTGELTVRLWAGTDEFSGYPIFTSTVDLAVPYAIGSSNFTFQQKTQAIFSAIGGAVDLATSFMGLRMASSAMNMADVAGTFNARRGGANPGAAFAYQQSAMSSASSAMTSGVYGIAQIGNAITTAITPTIQSTGGIGGSSARGLGIVCYVITALFKAVDNANYQGTYGHPVFLVTYPVTGYCQTQGFTGENINCRLYVKQKICSMMDAGVFIEEPEVEGD